MRHNSKTGDLLFMHPLPQHREVGCFVGCLCCLSGEMGSKQPPQSYQQHRLWIKAFMHTSSEGVGFCITQSQEDRARHSRRQKELELQANFVNFGWAGILHTMWCITVQILWLWVTGVLEKLSTRGTLIIWGVSRSPYWEPVNAMFYCLRQKSFWGKFVWPD